MTDILRQPLISIIIPTYNAAPYIRATIKSLCLEQCLPNDVELVVIDDGSTDTTCTEVRSATDGMDRIHIISQANGGVSAARNRGIATATGKYLFFLDSDDQVIGKNLSSIAALLREHAPDLLTVSMKRVTRLEMPMTSDSGSINSGALFEGGVDYIAENNYNNGPCWYFSNKRFIVENKLNFREDQILEDARFTTEVFLKARSIFESGVDFYRYIRRPGSLTTKRSREQGITLISSQLKNILFFSQIIHSLELSSHPRSKSCVARLRERRASFVYFGVIAGLRNGVATSVIRQFRNACRECGAVPLTKFSRDYRDFRTRLGRVMVSNGLIFELLLCTFTVLGSLKFAGQALLRAK